MMEQLLAKFLNYTKPLDLVLEKLNLKETVQESFQFILDYTKRKDIFLVIQAPPNLNFSGDKILIKQCFQNLFQNAFEAMPEGGNISVLVQPEKDSLKIQIADQGEGIPKEILDKVFNPFFTTKEKGTGLGLSLVKKIVNLHQGRIQVQSQLNWGTQFSIYLPKDPQLKTEIRKLPEKVYYLNP